MASPAYFATQGWVVLMDAAMPVLGETGSMIDDSFVDQGVASAAAIDALDAREIIDARRVVAGGHSYGALMVATLLAHSNLFAAGTARNGAHNRTQPHLDCSRSVVLSGRHLFLLSRLTVFARLSHQSAAASDTRCNSW